MNAVVRSSLVGAGIGAGLMFMLDPARGNRRRALVRNKAVRFARRSRDVVNATRRDVGNRVQGIGARVRHLRGDEIVDDRIIIERVRAELGRVASHPRAIEVRSENGSVTLTGDILADEVSAVVSVVESVRGVCSVDNAMIVHESGEGVPSLQGLSDRPGHWAARRRSGWSPTGMLIAGAAATASLAAASAAAARRTHIGPAKAGR